MNGFMLTYHPTTAASLKIDNVTAPDLGLLGITVSLGGVESFTTGRNNLALIDGYALGVSSERLASALEDQDDEFLARIHGNYCAVIVQPNGDIVGFCDRYGARTLFWETTERHGLVISSRWLAMPVCDVKWDELGLSEMLRYRWTTGTESLVAGISQLPHQFRVSFRRDGEVSLLPKGPQRRWPTRIRGMPFNEKLDETRTALTNAIGEVARHYDNAAIFLSGGVDSSLLAALSKSRFRKCLLITSVFPGQDNPELETAKAFVATLGTEHLLVDIDTARIEKDLRELVTAKGGQVNFHMLAMQQLLAAIPEDYELVICGDGADTLFGLRDFARTEQLLYRKRFANLIPSFAASLLSRLPNERIRKWCRLKETSYLDICLRHEQIQYEPASLEVIRGLANADTDKLFMHAAVERFRTRANVNFRRLLQGAALKCNSANMFREIDLSASRFGKKVFLPFLAEPVFQAAMTLTREQFLGDEYVKPILRELACEHFDRDLIYRRKHGFEVPFRFWLDKPLGHLVEKAKQERQLFDGELLRDLDVNVHYSLFWTLICWQLVTENLLVRQQRRTLPAIASQTL